MTYWTEDLRIGKVLDRKAAGIVEDYPPGERQRFINLAADKLAVAILTDPSMHEVDAAQMANDLRTELRKRIN